MCNSILVMRVSLCWWFPNLSVDVGIERATTYQDSQEKLARVLLASKRGLHPQQAELLGAYIANNGSKRDFACCGLKLGFRTDP